MTEEGRSIIFAVAFPPPLHGQSAVNEAVWTLCGQQKASLIRCDISPGRRARGSLRYHTNRIFKVLVASCHLIRHAGNRANCYFVFESGFGFLYNILLLSLARLLRQPITLHHHTSQHTIQFSHAFSIVARLAGRSATHVVLCEAMRQDIEARYRCPGQFLVCDNSGFINAREVKSIAETTLPFAGHFGFIANITVEKGIQSAIDAFRAVRLMLQGARLSVAGPIGDMESVKILESAAAEFGPCVQYLGPLDGIGKAAFFQEIDALLFPTRYRYEAQPLVIYEAYAYGKPVLATTRGYIRGMMADQAHCVDSLELFAPHVCAHAEKWISDQDSYRAATFKVRTFHQHRLANARLQRGHLIDHLCG